MILLLGAAGCTMFMRTPKFVEFEQAVVLPADDVFRRDVEDVQPVWRGRIEAGSMCVYEGRKADIVYINCPVALDLRETEITLPEKQ